MAETYSELSGGALVADFWFPAFSSSGRLAVGSQRVVVYPSAQDAAAGRGGVDLGPGTSPTWAGETLYFRRQPDGALMKWTAGSPVLVDHLEYNEFAAAGAKWVGYTTKPEPRLIWQDGVPWPGYADPALSANRYACLHHATGFLVSEGQIIDQRICREPKLADALLVWTCEIDKRPRSFGQRALGQPVEELTLGQERQFWPVPLSVAGQPWLLVVTDVQKRLVLYPWGSSDGYVVHKGVANRPAVWVNGATVTAAWTDDAGHLGISVTDTAAPRTSLLSTTGNIELTGNIRVRLQDFFVGAEATWPRDGSHYVDQKWDGRNFWLMKFGPTPPSSTISDNWERWVFDGVNWYLREDRSQSGAGDYSFHPGLWAYGEMKLGEWLVCDPNAIQRYDPLSGIVTDQDIFPYRTAVTKVWRQYDCGGDIGVVTHPTAPMAIEFTYDPGGLSDTYETYLFARGYGLVRWSVVDQKTHRPGNTTYFNLRSHLARLNPTKGHWKELQDNVNTPGVEIKSYGPVLTKATNWKAVVKDRNNPGVEVIVEILNGSLHVTLTNPKGSNRSGNPRPISIG